MPASSIQNSTATAVASIVRSTATASENEFLLSCNKAGFIKIGMSVDEARQRYGEQATRIVDLQLEAMPAPAIAVYLVKNDTNTASITGELGWGHGPDKIARINVRDPQFKTDKGIGVGATLGMLRKAYTITYINDTPLRAVVEDIHMTFLLDGDPPKEFYETRDKNLVPNEAVIHKVFMNGCR